MRARLVTTSIIAGSCTALALLTSVAAAQTAAPAPAPRAAAPAAAPGTTAPAGSAAPAAPKPPAASAPAAPPPAAATAAPAPVDSGGAEAQPERFELRASLRGTGGELNSDQAAKRATETAPSVAKAEAAAHKAELAAEQANILVWPRLEVEARYTLLSNVDPPMFTAMLGGGANLFRTQQHNGLFQARLQYPVSSLFFTIIPRHKAALKSAEAQKLQTRIQQMTIALQARVTFFNYVRSRASLLVAKAALGQTEAQRRDVDALVSAGSLAKVELMRADARVASAQVAVARTGGAVAIARAQLYTLVHLEGNDDVTITEDFEHELPALVENADALLAKALANRTELRQLRTILQALEHSVDAAQGAELPQVVLGASADYDNPNQRYFEPRTWHGSWAAYASLVWSPNDWQTNGSIADQTRADIAQALADLEGLEDALRNEVTGAFEDYGASRAALESARIGITAADESYRVRREQFRAGASTATEIVDAESELTRARIELVNAIIDMHIAKARLDRAIEAS